MLLSFESVYISHGNNTEMDALKFQKITKGIAKVQFYVQV